MSLPETTARRLTVSAHAAFVPIGVATVLLGPMLPELSARWSLNYSQAGALFTAQFIGSTLGVICSGHLVARRGYRFAINIGLFIMAVGVAALPVSSRLPGMICIAVYGLGSGVAVPAGNLLVAELNPARRSAALTLLNFSWSLGAVICPFLIAIAITLRALPIFLDLIAAFLLVALLAIAAIPLPDHSSRRISPADPREDPSQPNTQLDQARTLGWRRPSAFPLAALFFLYVGTEISFGGWVASYAKGLQSFPPAWAVISPSFFYGSLMLGRWIAPALLRRVEDVRLARIGLVLAFAGMAGMIASHALLSVILNACIAGLGFSTVYPIMISLLSREFGTGAARIGSVMFALSNLGGACLPWLVGYSSKISGEIRSGLLVPLIAAALMCALYSRNWGPPERSGSIFR